MITFWSLDCFLCLCWHITNGCDFLQLHNSVLVCVSFLHKSCFCVNKTQKCRNNNIQEWPSERCSLINTNIKCATNLTAIQHHILKSLKNHPRFIISMSNKHLGPEIMEKIRIHSKNFWPTYLCDGKTYCHITLEQARTSFEDFYEELQKLIYIHKYSLKGNEKIYFTRILNNPNQILISYGSLKVHKKIVSHVGFRPVNSNCGSISAVVSSYIDYNLQNLI